MVNYKCLVNNNYVIFSFIHVSAWKLRAVGQKHLKCFKTWCWRRMEKMSWTEHVRNE
jgi:hypothetical protein